MAFPRYVDTRVYASLLFLLISSSLFSLAKAQISQLNNQALTSTTQDVAIALDMIPFSIGTMKAEAVVLAEDLIINTPNQEIIGRSAFASPTSLNGASSSNYSSNDVLRKVIQPPQRKDFNLNGAVAYLKSSRSPVIQNYGLWEASGFDEVDKLIFDQKGYLIAQKSYYYPEEVQGLAIEVEGGWLNRFWWPGKNRNNKKIQAEADKARKLLQDGQRRKIEGCYALDIDFIAEGFDCFDAENRTLSVTEWSPKGDVTKKESYQLHADGPWVQLHSEESFVAPKYNIERLYDVAGNLIEYKSSGDISKKHLRFFYNENGKRVTEAVLDFETAKARECKFLIYGYFDTLEAINYYSVNRINQGADTQNDTADNSQASAFRSPLAQQQDYTCEKEIPSILTLEQSTVMDYGWLYDNDGALAGRRRQEVSQYNASGGLIERTIYSYLESSPTTLVAINKYDGFGQSNASIVFDYDKQSRLIKEERFQYGDGEVGRLLEQSNYIYKAKESTLLEKTVEDYEHSRSKSIQQFDEAGNIIREQRYELFNRFGFLNNMFRIKSDESKSYTGRSFVNEMRLEAGNTEKHESYSYQYDYAQNTMGGILNWIQKDEGSIVNKFDSSYSEPHHTNARLICYYPDALAMSSDLICTSPFN